MDVWGTRYAEGEFGNVVVKQLLFFRHLDCSGESSEVVEHGPSVGPRKEVKVTKAIGVANVTKAAF